MKHAIYQGREVDGEEGVDIREQMRGSRPDFHCCECGRPAKVMRAGGNSRHTSSTWSVTIIAAWCTDRAELGGLVESFRTHSISA